jgi:hypothetical protein
MPEEKIKKAVGVYRDTEAPRKTQRSIGLAALAVAVLIAVVAYLLLGR